MNIGEQINYLRKQKGLSQDEFANILKISRQTVSNWENGKSYPDLEMIVTISNYFQVSVDELLKQDVSVADKTNLEKKSDSKKKKGFIIVSILIALLVWVIVGVYLKIEADRSVRFIMSKDKTFESMESKISVANGYFSVPQNDHLDIKVEAETDDGELHILITNEEKQVYYQLDGQSLKDEQTLYFKEGSYSVQIVADEYTEKVVSLNYHIEIEN